MSRMAQSINVTEATARTAAPSTAGPVPQPMVATKANGDTAGAPAEHEAGTDGMARSSRVTEANGSTAAPSASLLVPQSKGRTAANLPTAGAPGARRPVGDLQPWGDLTMLRKMSECLVDATKARISTKNRFSHAPAADAVNEDIDTWKRMLKAVHEHEKFCQDMLIDIYTSKVPAHVREWAAGIPGMASGELFPKLIGLAGHPRIAVPMRWEDKVLVPAGEPYYRTPRQFLQFCGCGDPERNPRDMHKPTQAQLLACGKRKSVRPVLHAFSSYLASSGKTVTKEKSKFLGRPRSEKIAMSHYFQIFAAAKADGENHVHQWQCQNRKPPRFAPNGCGTVAHPEWGEPGSPWRSKHAEMHAHKMVHRAFLLDLWNVCEI